MPVYGSSSASGSQRRRKRRPKRQPKSQGVETLGQILALKGTKHPKRARRTARRQAHRAAVRTARQGSNIADTVNASARAETTSRSSTKDIIRRIEKTERKEERDVTKLKITDAEAGALLDILTVAAPTLGLPIKAGKAGATVASNVARALGRADDAVDTVNLARGAYAGTKAQKAAAAMNKLRGTTKTRGPVRRSRDGVRRLRGKDTRPAKPRRVGSAEAGFATQGALATTTGAGAIGAAIASDEAHRNVATLPAQLGMAAVEDPGSFAGATARTAKDAALGFFPAVYQIGAAGFEAATGDTDRAEELWTQVKTDYEQRYGPLVEGDFDTFRERVINEYGLTPFAFDAMILSPGASRVLGGAARQGFLGSGAQSFATRARPGLLTRAGEGAVEQPLSRGLIGVGAQRTVDRIRAGRTEARAERPIRFHTDDASDPMQAGTVMANALADQARRSGDVVPVFQNRALRKDVAESTGRARQSMQREQLDQVHRGILKNAYDNLTKLQRNVATKYAIQFGVRGGPEDAVPHMIERRQQIVDDREKQVLANFNDRLDELIDDEGNSPEPLTMEDLRDLRDDDPGADTEAGELLLEVERDVLPPKAWDEIKAIDALIDNADTVFTPELARFADTERRRAKRTGQVDPGFDVESQAVRTYQQQADYLGKKALREAEELERVAKEIPDTDPRKAVVTNAAAERRAAAEGMKRQVLPEEAEIGVTPYREVDGTAAVLGKPENRLLKEADKELAAQRKKIREKEASNDTKGLASMKKKEARLRELRDEEKLMGEDADFFETKTFKKWSEIVTRKGERLGYEVEINPAAGRWAGGDEPSAVVRIKGALDPEVVDGFVADLGRLGRQEAVIRFVASDAGKDFAYVYDVADLSDDAVEAAVNRADLPGSTHELEAGRLVVSGKGRSMEDAAEQLADYLGTEGVVVRGNFGMVEAPSYGEAIGQAGRRVEAQASDTGGTAGFRGIRNRGEGQPREAADQYVSRVREEAGRQGLEDPGYFPSQFPRRQAFSPFALGGSRAIASAKKYRAKLFERGIEDPRVAVLALGAAQNIKRKHNWNIVARTWERHSFKWSRDKTPTKILEEAAKRGVSEESIALVNVERVYENLENFDPANPDRNGFKGDWTDGDPMVASIMDGAVLPGDKLKTLSEEFRRTGKWPPEAGTGKWSAIPAAVQKELTASHKDTLFGRLFDVAISKQSRFLLGSLNIPWLQFQIMSNAVMAGIGGAGPVAWAQAAVWWNKLSEEQKRAIEPYIGDGHFTADVRQPRLGASANNGLTNSYRAFKETVGGAAIWPSAQRTIKRGKGKGRYVNVRDLNPLDLMFRADTAQNNFFRRAVFYSSVKRDAYKRMGGRMKAIGKSQDDIMKMIALGPEEQMRWLLNNRSTLERHAKQVQDFMGDYMSFTAAERRYFKRNVMFYGFLRFSLRLALYTLPTKRPVAAGILGQLGRMQTEEVRELLGGDHLPYALGRIYKDDGNMVLDLQRANPVMNALTQSLNADSPAQLSGLFPPLYGSIASQLFNVEPFTGEQYTVNGENQPREYDKLGIFDPDRLEIFASQGLKLFYPYRVYEEFTRKGQPVSTDSVSLPFGIADPNLQTYSDPEVKRSLAKTRREQEDLYPSLLSFLGADVTPFTYKPSRDVEIAKSVLQRIIEEREKLDGKPSSSSSSSGGYSSGFGSSGGYTSGFGG